MRRDVYTTDNDNDDDEGDDNASNYFYNNGTRPQAYGGDRACNRMGGWPALQTHVF